MVQQIETGLHMIEYYLNYTIIHYGGLEMRARGVSREEIGKEIVRLAKADGREPDNMSLLRLWKNQLSEPAVVVDKRYVDKSRLEHVEKLALPVAWAKQVYDTNLVADKGRFLANMFVAVTLSDYLANVYGALADHYDVDPWGKFGSDGFQGVRSPRGRYSVDTL